MTAIDFGVLSPHSSATAEVAIQAGSEARVRLAVKFTQPQARSIALQVSVDNV